VPTKEAVQALVTAAGDDYRLVRVRAASSLSSRQDLPLDEAQKKTVEAAREEFLTSLLSRPDQWGSYYNLGNYYLNRGDFKQAKASYDTALKLEPRAVLAMVNESIAYARSGENQRANDMLQKALKVAPDNAAVNFNMGLLKAEQNDLKQAEKHLRAAFKTDPQMAQAAYNICVITAKDRLEEALGFCRKASALRPDEPRYAYTLAFYLDQHGDKDEAVSTLNAIVAKYPTYRDAQLLLQKISKTKDATP
jgi:tetratricopeptide (TPR) repeat protein